MKVFLDTNILLDLLLERPGYEASARVLELCREKEYTMAGSILTMVNVAYVYRKTVGQDLAVVNLKYLSGFIEVLPMDTVMLNQAIGMSGRDFEDTLQAVCAATGGCDYIVTRNVKDYSIKRGLSKPISLPKVITPGTFAMQHANVELPF